MSATDYQTMYREYWQRQDRWGTSSFTDAEALSAEIAATCAIGPMLDCGCGMGALVTSLLARGIDAHGADVSDTVIDHLAAAHPGRFHRGSLLDLPFPDGAFATVICTDVLEHLTPVDVPNAIAELRRVCRRHLFVIVGTKPDRDGAWHLTVEHEDWWLDQFLAAGFRRHPRWFDLVPYGENTAPNARIPLEIIDPACSDSLVWLREHRNLHMDMLREAGRRADAHLVRYAQAARLLRPGDMVVDAACGYGYGTHLIAAQANCRSALGLDASPRAIDYAARHYSGNDSKTSFQICDLDQPLPLPDASVDVVVSFETLEHIPRPTAFLAEVRRILKPSGRLIASVPNDWTDEAGRDPNPEHLHVYTWDRLQQEVGHELLLERAWSQTAGGGMKHPRTSRKLQEYPPAALTGADTSGAEWWLVAAMRDPHEGLGIPFRDSGFPSEGISPNPIAHNRTWANPWLFNAIGWIGHRLTAPDQLDAVSRRAVADPHSSMIERGAALCVLGYMALHDGANSTLLAAIADYIATPIQDPHHQRWIISLTFLRGLLLLRRGERLAAAAAFSAAAQADPLPFSPLLATKTVEAAWMAARLAAADGDHAQARTHLGQGIAAAIAALADAGSSDAIGNTLHPLPFAWRELAQVADAAQRCTDLLLELDLPLALSYGFQAATSHRDTLEALSRQAQQHAHSQEPTLADMIAAKDSDLAALAADVHRLEAVCTDKEAVVAELSDEVRRLEHIVADKDTAVATVVADVRRLEAVCTDKEAVVAELTDEIRRLEHIVTQKDNAVATVAADVHRLEAVCTDKEAVVAKLSGEIYRLERACSDKDTVIAAQGDELRQRNADQERLIAHMRTIEAELARRDEALHDLELQRQDLIASLACTTSDLAQHQAWMQERNEQLAQLRYQSEDLTEKLQQAYVRVQSSERHAEGLALQVAAFRARPVIRLMEAWRSPWNRSTFPTMVRCLAQMALPGVMRRLIKRLLCRSQRTPVNNTGAYQVRLHPALPADAPVVVHAIANFWLGGSSRLVIDLIEGTGHHYHHHVFTSAVAVPAPYLGVEPDVLPGVPSVESVEARLRARGATALHLHYWGECDEPWYAVCAQAAHRLGLPIIQNVNTPVAPLLDPPMTELVPVSTYVQAHFCSGRGTVIYPGSDFVSFSGSPEHAARQDAVGMVYRLEDDKLGVEAIAPFIELVRIRPRTRIYIIGGGSLLETFRRRVDDAGVSASFTFTGYVQYNTLPNWYRRFGVFMAPVRKESFGQVSPFAMSMGIPVVGYDVGAISEIIADPSLVAPAGDAVALAQITANLLADPQRRLAVGIAQQRRAHDNFSLRSMIDAYLQVYGRILTSSPSP